METKEKIKKHIKDNKHIYGYGILTAVICGLVIRKQPITNVINTVAPIFNNSNETSLGGPLRKIIYCIELDRYFPSVTEAAKYAEIAIQNMSRHINGHTPDVNGLHYKIVGVSN